MCVCDARYLFVVICLCGRGVVLKTGVGVVHLNGEGFCVFVCLGVYECVCAVSCVSCAVCAVCAVCACMCACVRVCVRV